MATQLLQKMSGYDCRSIHEVQQQRMRAIAKTCVGSLRLARVDIRRTQSSASSDRYKFKLTISFGKAKAGMVHSVADERRVCR